MKQKNLYEIMINERLLFEDFNSFKSKSLEIINNDIDKDEMNMEMTKQFGSLNNFLKKLFDIVDKSDYVKNIRALMFFIHTGIYSYNPRYLLNLLDVYVNLSKKNTKQYGIKLIKLNDNPKSRDILYSPENLRAYLLSILNKIKEIKDVRSGKIEAKDDRRADIILLNNKDVTISLFTKYSTSKNKFEGMTDWCTAKHSFRWNQYTRDGILVLFRDKSIKLVDKKETPNAYYCNHYNVFNSNELDIPKTYDMKDDQLFHPNFTTKYHKLVEEECKKIFDNDLMNHDKFIEFVSNEDDGDSSGAKNLFQSVLNKFLVDDRVLAHSPAMIGSDYDGVYNYDSKLLEEIEEEVKLMNGAEFYHNLNIFDINIDDDVDFPPIGFVGGELYLAGVYGTIEIYNNSIKNLIIGRGVGASVVFYSELYLSFAKINNDDENCFYSDSGIFVEKLEIANETFTSVETSGSATIGINDWGDISFKTEDRGSELKFSVYMDVSKMSIEGFEKVYITISDDLDVEEYIKFDKGIKEVHFDIVGDYDTEELKNMIADETLEFDNDNVKIFYSNDR